MEQLTVRQEAEYVDSIISPQQAIETINVESIAEARTKPGGFHWFYFDKLYSIMKQTPPSRVLDVACGVGFLSVLLAKYGHMVVAVDISKNSIANARKLAMVNNCQDKIDFRIMDVSQLNLETDSFDIVTGEDALHHIIKYPGAAENIYRVLKPGGKACFTEPFAFNPLINLMRSVNVKIRNHKGEQFLGKNELKILSECFDEIKISDKSVIYILSRFFSKPNTFNNRVNILLKKADDVFQKYFPFIKRFYAMAFIELSKKN
jgi:ubiquinone/menaquinone biosynthesis C-methylase UbiE